MGERGGVLKHLPLGVPCGPQSSLFFPIPYLSLQGWPMPGQTTEGEFPLPLPESEVKIQCERMQYAGESREAVSMCVYVCL